MNIVIIGTGNTATVLGRKLKGAGHSILQVFGRNTMAASNLAYELDTESTNYWNVVHRHADVYILAVSDIAVEEVAKELQLPQESIVVHTAGSVPKSVLQKIATHYGVLYPLQSMRKESSYVPDVPILIDASDDATFSVLQTLAYSISAKVISADDHQRQKMHLAAVLCNNFINHLFVLAEEYCKKEGIDFMMLLPLIRETVARLDQLTPAQSQTGPALRNDKETINRHLALLEHHPGLKKIYELLTESIYQHR